MPFGLVLSRLPAGRFPTARIEKTEDAVSPTGLRQFVLNKLYRSVKKTREASVIAASRYMRYHDRNARPAPKVSVDDSVFVNRHPAYKLTPEEKSEHAK